MNGKRVLITGGAGGLGKTACLAFASQGARVVALDHGNDKAAELAQARAEHDAIAGAILSGIPDAIAGSVRGSIQGSIRGSIDYLDADLGDTEDLLRTIDRDIASNGGFDVLVNNAAIYPSKGFLDYTESELLKVHAINTHAPLCLAQRLVPHMQTQRWGRIINISSITFHGGWGGLLPYVTSKGALVGATRALARELGPSGITVNCVSPGAFPTAAEAIHPDPDGYNAMVLDRQSIKQRGHASDIAHALLFFASDQSGFITGQTLEVDGGWYMS